MRSSLLLLALAVVNGATVALSSALRSTKYTTKRDSVSDYLNELTPVAKDVLVNQLAGPAIGADVDPSAPLPDAVNTDTILIAWCRHLRSP